MNPEEPKEAPASGGPVASDDAAGPAIDTALEPGTDASLSKPELYSGDAYAYDDTPPAELAPPAALPPSPPIETAVEPVTDAALSTPELYSGDAYTYDTPPAELAPPAAAPPPSPPKPPADESPDEEDGMLRMSFLEHLEELRTRLLRALIGIAIAFAASLFFQDQMWEAVVQPVLAALRTVGVKDPKLIVIDTTEAFFILWVKLPIIAALFLASPWVLYQVWAFIAPGLYQKERRYATPFVLSSAGLFIAGGLFAYFVAFRFGLAFLLGIGIDKGIEPMITVGNYFDLFMSVMLGVGLVFELPILIFLLTLLRVVTPKFLIDNSRYAILIIVIVAAIVTPTPDVFNLMLFSVPMCILYYVGIFAGYLLTLSREGKRFPWIKVLFWMAVVAGVIGGLVYLAVTNFGYHLVPYWPFLTR